MNHRGSILSILLLGAISASGHAVAKTRPDGETTPAQTLFDTIQKLDTAVFDAFNECSDPEQLKLHESHFAPDVEFYHDTGGVTWTRDDMIANTRKFACGNYRRELVPGTMQVYPIKDFGAISRGTHRFCSSDSGKCEGIADFVLVWQVDGDQWHITRSLSFGHQPNL